MPETKLDTKRRHPYYIEQYNNWKFYWDTFLGPDHYAKPIKSDDTSKSYLFPFPAELQVKGRFKDRHNRSPFISNTKRAVLRIAKYIFSAQNAPNRVYEDYLDSYVLNCDLAFKSRDQYLKRALIESLVVGKSINMLNRTSIDGETYALNQDIMPEKLDNFSIYDAFVTGVRSFWVPISIFNLYDWKINNGLYEWAIVHSIIDTGCPWTVLTERYKHRYFVLMPDVIYEYEASQNRMYEADLVDEYENILGVVPLFDFIPADLNNDDKPDMYSSDLAHIDRQIYQTMSGLVQEMDGISFPSLAVQKGSLGNIKEILVSPTGLLEYTGDKPPFYVTPPTGTLEARFKLLMYYADAFDRISGLSKPDVDINVAESGKAKIVDFQEDNTMLSDTAQKIEDYENMMSRLTMINDGLDEYSINARYKEDYNIQSESTKVALLKELKALYSDDPEKQLLVNVLGLTLFKDLPEDFRDELANQTQKDYNKLQELKKQKQKPQPKPIVGKVVDADNEQPDLFPNEQVA